MKVKAATTQITFNEQNYSNSKRNVFDQNPSPN